MNIQKFNLGFWNNQRIEKALLIAITIYTVITIELTIWVIMTLQTGIILYFTIILMLVLIPIFLLIYFKAKHENRKMMEYMNEMIYEN